MGGGARTKAHRATTFNNDYGDIANGRMSSQKYWKRDTHLCSTTCHF